MKTRHFVQQSIFSTRSSIICHTRKIDRKIHRDLRKWALEIFQLLRVAYSIFYRWFKHNIISIIRHTNFLHRLIGQCQIVLKYAIEFNCVLVTCVFWTILLIEIHTQQNHKNANSTNVSWRFCWHRQRRMLETPASRENCVCIQKISSKYQKTHC